MTKKRIALLYGGRSGEHEVSCCSAASVFEHLNRDKYDILPVGIDKQGHWHPAPAAVPVEDPSFGKIMPLVFDGEWLISPAFQGGTLTITEKNSSKSFTVDCVFPVLHGTNCEDGRLQGLLELCGVPYVGSGVTGSAIGMDKDYAKRLLEHSELPVVPWITVTRREWENEPDFILQDINLEFGFPCFVKPANSGSSVGIYKIKDKSELKDSIEKAFAYDSKVLFEKAINCREIEFAILGNDDLICSQPGEIVPSHEFYSYEAKYIDSDGAKLFVPAPLDDETVKAMQSDALSAYKVLGLSGLCRIDFFIDKNDDTWYINEVNTFPGFTSISMYPRLMQHSAIPYNDLLDRLVQLSFDMYSRKSSLVTDFTRG